MKNYNIKNVFTNHGYSELFISKSHKKARRIFYEVTEKKPFLKENESLLVLPQTLGKNEFETYLGRCNVKCVYKNSNTIRKYFNMNARQNNNPEKPGIYCIPCKDCPKVYVGESIDLERRKNQHKDSLRKGDKNSALFQHRNMHNHKIFTDDMFKVLSVENTEKRKLLESFLIQNIDTYNIYKSNFKVDTFINTLLKKHVKAVDRLLQNSKPPP